MLYSADMYLIKETRPELTIERINVHLMNILWQIINFATVSVSETDLKTEPNVGIRTPIRTLPIFPQILFWVVGLVRKD